MLQYKIKVRNKELLSVIILFYHLSFTEFYHVLHRQQGNCMALCHSQQNRAPRDHAVLFRTESWELMNVEWGENLQVVWTKCILFALKKICCNFLLRFNMAFLNAPDPSTNTVK